MDGHGDTTTVLFAGSDPQPVATALAREPDGFTVDIESSMTEAVELLRGRTYDCVVVATSRGTRDADDDARDADDGALDPNDLRMLVRTADEDIPVVGFGDAVVGETPGEAVLDGITDVDVTRLARRIATVVASRRAVREAERREERLERFVEVVSHDLRNPLNVAQGRIDLARESCASADLETAADAIDRSLDLIADLLTLAREGETVSATEPVDLAALAETCWSSVQTPTATLRVDVERSIAGKPGRVKQLLENLFSNAIRHGGDDVVVTVGSIEPFYTATRGGDDGGAGFYVADDGAGIPPDARDRVFDTGYTTASDGTGFGLNIAAEIATAHGWEIDVTASRTGGARFEVTGVETVE
jgi:signal transduction histidine kinase